MSVMAEEGLKWPLAVFTTLEEKHSRKKSMCEI